MSGATPVAVPTDQGSVVRGQEIYVRNGCVNCHGPTAYVDPYLASPDKAETIPPLSGATFRGEFNTPKKIKDVIVSGSVLGRAPIVSMKNEGSFTPAELNALVAYLTTLKRARDAAISWRIQVVIAFFVRRYTVSEFFRSGSAKSKMVKHRDRRP